MAIRNTPLGGTDYQTSGSTLLNGALNNSATTITVDATASFKTVGIIKIDNELITYTGKNATQFTGCTRGTYSTTAASHLDNAPVTEKEIVKAADLNDTFDAAVTKIQSLSAFWLNTDLYDVYDDFNSYATAAFTDTADWDVTVTGEADAYIVASTNAGGDTKEIRLRADDRKGTSGNNEVTLLSKTLDANKHTWCRIYAALSALRNRTMTFSVTFDNGSTYYTAATCFVSDIANSRATHTAYMDMLVVAKGSDVYDIYVGGKKQGADVNIATPQIGFKISIPYTDGTDGVLAGVYIDDIRQSKSTITA